MLWGMGISILNGQCSVNISVTSSTICQGTSVTFTATPVNSGTTPIYQWKVNGVNAGTNSNIFISSTLENSDRITVDLTDSSCNSGNPVMSNVITMTVNEQIVPTFNQIGPLLLNTAPPALPQGSTNTPAITGTWTPSTIITVISGIRTYLFTPTPGQCATTATMDINILSPSLTITKLQASGPNPVTGAGQVITYYVDVINTGNVDMTGINVTEIYPGTGAGTLSAPVESISSNSILNAGERWSYTASYTVTQADMDAGNNLVNIARVVTTQIPVPLTSRATTMVTGAASMTITKDADEANYSAAGNILHYIITVTNTGSVTLTNVTVTDPLTGLTQNIDALVPGASRTFNTTYAIIQNDLSTGIVDNTATASSTYRGITYTVIAKESVSATQTPGLIITKNSAEPGYNAPGNILHYTITVTNTGNVILDNIQVSDPLTGLNQNISLSPGERITFNTIYTIIQDDINLGHVNNTARATYTFGGSQYSETASVRVPAAQNPSLSITKNASELSYSSVNDILHYTIIVRNTGNVTLSNVTVTDPNTLITCSGSPYTLTPNSSRTCNATHVVTNNDITSGSVINTATATGYDPDMVTVTGTSNTVILLLNNIAPMINCPASLTVSTEPTSCDALISSGLSTTYSDANNNILSLTWRMSGANVDTSPLNGIYNLQNYRFSTGVTTVTYTVTDRPGLSSSCSFTMTVIDNVPPVVVCLAPQDRNTDYAGPYYTVTGTELDPVSVWDNCSVARVTNDFNGLPTLAGAHLPIGITTVMWIVTDINGNSADCSFTVTVTGTDNVNPIARCKNITVYLDLITGTYVLAPGEIDDGSFDNTGIASVSVNLTNFDCSDLGPNNVTLTAIDFYGNTGTCTAVVTVLYEVAPNPVINTDRQVLCDDEYTDLVMTSNITNTTWTWNVNSSPSVSEASVDNTGNATSIIQHLDNSDTLVHDVTYIITPRVYGQCDLPSISATVMVNPTPEIRVISSDTVMCSGENTLISVRNPNVSVHGQWTYDLLVIPDQAITGNSSGGTFTGAVNIYDTLVNNDTRIAKVVYRFIPRIISGEELPACPGTEEIITIWVYPGINYTKNISEFDGFNISCYGKSDGFIRIQSGESDPLNFKWIGPDGFESTTEDIRGLQAGKYTVTVADKNLCSVNDSIIMKEPDQLSMKIDPSISYDGAFNINCAGEKTGSVTVSAVNNVGPVNYLWSDGMTGNERTSLSSGTYKIIITDSNNCISDSTVTLTQPERLQPAYDISLPICPDNPDGKISMTATGGVPGNDYIYEWADKSTGSTISDIKAGIYYVTTGDMNGCSVTTRIHVDALNEICLSIPEAFSPNGDLKNDVWNIGNTELYPKMEVLIYNRWGQFLWRSEQGYPKVWDGMSNGRELPIDSYHYVIDLHNGTKPIAGSVTIVR